MQNAALRAAGLPGWRYQLLPVPAGLFEETVRALHAAGFRGANVTVPHKERALALADAPTDRARAIGAANTLWFESGGEIGADNTDAPALIEALSGVVELAGATALVLGAGGSARAAVWALLGAGAEVAVWNRTPGRARELCAALGGTPVTALTPAALLINCTSIGLDANDDPFKQLPLSADAICAYECVVDFVYGQSKTRLAAAAAARGVPVVDGTQLLVGQGALSFERFTGLPAPRPAMRAALGGR